MFSVTVPETRNILLHNTDIVTKRLLGNITDIYVIDCNGTLVYFIKRGTRLAKVVLPTPPEGPTKAMLLRVLYQN